MVKVSEDVIQLLKNIASNSPVKYKHSAALLQGNKVITVGNNKHLDIKYNNEGIKISIHAEIDCMSNCKNVKGLDLIVIRVNKKGELRNSKPCQECLEKLRKKGIRNVIYSNDLEELEEWNVGELQTDHHSLWNKVRKN